MTQSPTFAELMAAGAALADLLARENAALSALDLAAAAGMYAEKATVTAAFAAAQQRDTDGKPPEGEAREAAERLAERLRELAEANKRLLERGIFVQGRVLGTIARALARVTPETQPPRYASSGALAQPPRPGAVMLSARA